MLAEHALEGFRFQSAPPAREATAEDWKDLETSLFQSAPPAREATTAAVGYHGHHEFQSAPPAREATQAANRGNRQRMVSIRASRAGGDIVMTTPQAFSIKFQSAPPAREATARWTSTSLVCPFQSAPPAREATRQNRGPYPETQVSIRASRAGGDVGLTHALSVGFKFQSAPPAREATFRADRKTKR